MGPSDQHVEVLAALGDIQDPRLGRPAGKLGVGSDWAATAWLLAGPDLLGPDQVGPWASLLGSVGETIRDVLVKGFHRHTDQGRSAEQQKALLLTDVVPSLQDALCERMTGSRRLAQ
jgi:hypothetical protein